jgi:sporulation protein YlmC with PRC-barrel domain
MRIQLGANVRTKDGQKAGKIAKVIWDPDRNEVREFVVTTGGLLGHDVLVSREVLERATADADELVVDLSKDELDRLDHYDDRAYAPPPYGWLVPAEIAYGADAFLFPTVVDQAKATNAAEPRRPVIKKGMTVKDAAGQRIGDVEELRIDDMTGELRAIVVRQGSDEHTLEIPADHLDIGGDDVHVIEGSPAKRSIG